MIQLNFLRDNYEKSQVKFESSSLKDLKFEIEVILFGIDFYYLYLNTICFFTFCLFLERR